MSGLRFSRGSSNTRTRRAGPKLLGPRRGGSHPHSPLSNKACPIPKRLLQNPCGRHGGRPSLVDSAEEPSEMATGTEPGPPETRKTARYGRWRSDLRVGREGLTAESILTNRPFSGRPGSVPVAQAEVLQAPPPAIPCRDRRRWTASQSGLDQPLPRVLEDSVLGIELSSYLSPIPQRAVASRRPVVRRVSGLGREAMRHMNPPIFADMHHVSNVSRCNSIQHSRYITPSGLICLR